MESCKRTSWRRCRLLFRTNHLFAFLENDDSSYSAQQERSASSGLEINPTPINTYESEVEDFSLAILEDRDLDIDIQSGIRNQKIIAACYESAKSKKVVEIV